MLGTEEIQKNYRYCRRGIQEDSLYVLNFETSRCKVVCGTSRYLVILISILRENMLLLVFNDSVFSHISFLELLYLWIKEPT